MDSSLFAAERGAGSKIVVFLHGFAGCHDVWRDVTAVLAPGLRMLAYDLPGHGFSLDVAGTSAKSAAKAILADLAARGVKRAHIVGHSMGGAVASLMALADPERIASLTLLAPGGFGPEINGPLLRRYAAATGKDEIRACLTVMSGPQSLPPEHVVDVLDEMRGRPNQLQKLVEIAAVMTRDDRQGVIPREQLATLPMPVMVVWGTDDAVLPFSQTDDLPAQFHLHHVLGVGHMLADEASDLIAEIVRRTIRRRARRPRSSLAAAS